MCESRNADFQHPPRNSRCLRTSFAEAPPPPPLPGCQFGTMSLAAWKPARSERSVRRGTRARATRSAGLWWSREVGSPLRTDPCTYVAPVLCNPSPHWTTSMHNLSCAELGASCECRSASVALLRLREVARRGRIDAQ